MTSYMLKYHQFYADRIEKLLDIAEKLYASLPRSEYRLHPTVKLLARMRQADQTIIAAVPNKRDYLLKGELSKYRRYKKGLGRFRMIFCFAANPPIIVYLYVNDDIHLRKAGSKNDPYQEFTSLIRKGMFSHNPSDPALQKWIKEKI